MAVLTAVQRDTMLAGSKAEKSAVPWVEQTAASKAEMSAE